MSQASSGSEKTCRHGMISDWKSLCNFNEIFTACCARLLWISQSIYNLEHPADRLQIYFSEPTRVTSQLGDLHILPMQESPFILSSPPGEGSQVTSAINAGLHKSSLSSHTEPATGVMKQNSAVWSWSAQTVVGLWRGEERRAGYEEHSLAVITVII